MARQYLDTERGTVEYTCYGDGQPVLFFHGGHSNSLDRLFHLGFDPRRFKLITPSGPGYGKTSLRNNESADATAALMAALLDGLGIHRATLYAASAGGPSAIAFAANYSDRVHKLVLASSVTTTWLGQEERKYRLAKRMFHPRVQQIPWLLVRWLAKDAPMLLAKRFFREFSAKSGHRITRREAFRLADALQYYDSGRGFFNDLTQEAGHEMLTRVVCPTLVLHSIYDASVAVKHAHHAKECIPHAQLVLLENPWGHMIWIDNCRTKVETRLKEFLVD